MTSFLRACVCARIAAQWVVVGGGLGLCRPRVISRDQASLMSAGSSRGTQALPTPSSPSPGTFWLHTAPCWTDSPNFTYLIPPFKQLQRILTYNLSLLCFYIYLSYTFYPLCFWVIILHTFSCRRFITDVDVVLALRPRSSLFTGLFRGKLPQKDIELTFPGMSGDFTSENFSATWYLIENHMGSR